VTHAGELVAYLPSLWLCGALCRLCWGSGTWRLLSCGTRWDISRGATSNRGNRGLIAALPFLLLSSCPLAAARIMCQCWLRRTSCFSLGHRLLLGAASSRARLCYGCRDVIDRVWVDDVSPRPGLLALQDIRRSGTAARLKPLHVLAKLPALVSYFLRTTKHGS